MIQLLAGLLAGALLGTPPSGPPSAVTPRPGELAVSPAAPRRAAQLSFAYRPGPAELATEPRLAVRARLRTATMDDRGDGSVVRFALLERGGDGVFRGTAELPDSVVYAAFLIERLDGGVVDAQGGRFVNIVVHDEDGLPSYHGLVQRAHDHLGRDYLTVLETGRALVELSPGRPFSWMVRIAAEEWVGGAASAAEARRLMQAHYPLLAAAAAADRDAPPEDLETLLFFANALDDDEAADAYFDRLQSRWPASAVSVRLRLAALAARLDGRHGELLDTLESEWARGERRPEVAEWGVMAGRRGGDESRTAAWSVRYAAAIGEPFYGIVRRARSRAHRAEALPLLREHVRLLAQGEHQRAFGRSVGQQQAANAGSHARALVALGEVLIEEGEFAEGLEALRAATRAVFWPWPSAALGDALLETGDSAAALAEFARLPHDRAADPAWPDSVRRRLGARFDPAAWDSLVATSRNQLIERAALRGIDQPIPQGLQLLDAAGAHHTLRHIAAAGPTLVVVWSRGCEASQRAMPAIRELVPLLAAAGGRVIAVTLDPPASDDAALRAERGVSVPVFHDTTGSTVAFLRATGSPQLFLLADGALRFMHSEPDLVPWQVEALQRSSRSRKARP